MTIPGIKAFHRTCSLINLSSPNSNISKRYCSKINRFTEMDTENKTFNSHIQIKSIFSIKRLDPFNI